MGDLVTGGQTVILAADRSGYPWPQCLSPLLLDNLPAGAEPIAAYLDLAAQGSEPLRLLRQRTLANEGYWIHQAFRQRQRETSCGFATV